MQHLLLVTDDNPGRGLAETFLPDVDPGEQRPARHGGGSEIQSARPAVLRQRGIADSRARRGRHFEALFHACGPASDTSRSRAFLRLDQSTNLHDGECLRGLRGR